MPRHFRVCASTGVKVGLSDIKDNWYIGIVTLPSGKKYEYNAKVYDEPSDYGIDCGKISKLCFWELGKNWGSCLCNYDRGWDVKPKTADAKAVYKALLDKYN